MIAGSLASGMNINGINRKGVFMAHSEDKVREMVQKIIDEMNLPRKISQVIYRDDYMDYRIILDGTHHCPIREKLVNIYLKDQDEDIRREIEFLLSHAVELEEWEKEEATEGGDYKSDIAVDNSQDYDF